MKKTNSCITSNICPLSCSASVTNSFLYLPKLLIIRNFFQTFIYVNVTTTVREQAPASAEFPVMLSLFTSSIEFADNSWSAMIREGWMVFNLSSRNRQCKEGRLLDRRSLSFTQISHLQSGEVGSHGATILPGSQVLLGTSQVVLGPKTQLRASRVRRVPSRGRVLYYCVFAT